MMAMFNWEICPMEPSGRDLGKKVCNGRQVGPIYDGNLHGLT